MLRVELGSLHASIYLERSNFPPETDVRIMFWNDQRKSGIPNRKKPDLIEISDDKRIFANDIITDNEWSNRTWTRFLEIDSVQGASCLFFFHSRGLPRNSLMWSLSDRAGRHSSESLILQSTSVILLECFRARPM